MGQIESNQGDDATQGIEIERQYRQLFEANPHPMWIFDSETLKFLAVNDAAVFHYGYTRDEFLSMTIKDIRPSDEVARLLADIKASHKGHDVAGLWKHKKKDGSLIDVDIVSHDLIWMGRPAKLVLSMDVTERRRAEESLRRSQQLLQDIIDNSETVIYGKDPEGRYLLVNQRFCDLFHVTQPDVLGKTDYDLFPKETADAFRSMDKRVEAAGGTLIDEETAPHDDGPHTYLSVKCPLIGDDGKPYLIFGVSTDITDRKLAEEALREAEERFRTVADFTADWEYWAGPDGRAIYVSPSCLGLTGYSAGEFMSDAKLSLKIVHPEDREAMAAHFRAGFESEQRSRELFADIDFRIIRKDGAVRWMNHTCRPVYGATGRWLGRRVSNRDITERKEAEERIRRLSRMYATLSQVNQAITRIKDRDTLFRTICQVAIEFGQFRIAWIGLNDPQTGAITVSAYHAADRESTSEDERSGLFSREPILPALQEGEIVDYDDIAATVGLETWRQAALDRGCHAAAVVPIRLRDKVIGVLSLYTATSAHFSDGEERSLLQEIGSDISFALDGFEADAEYRRTLEARARLEEQLHQAQKLESIGRLAGGIAHDFNNLLGVIIGYCELILLNAPQDDPWRHQLKQIKSAGERAAALTHQLLAFSRKQVIEPKVFDLNSAIADISRMLERIIGEDVALIMRLCDGRARIKADRGQIEQVVMNLVVNARDAMPSGGRLTIETANVIVDDAYAREHFPIEPGSFVMLAVTDTGIGMDAETQQRIFEPFFTTKEKGKGTGLGLSTVYGIVQQSQGVIWVYSEVGRGTTFKIYLPSVDAAEESVSKVEPGQFLNGNETILIVEDAEGIRKLAEQCLKSKGYRVLSAGDAREAIQLSKENRGRIHLLLTDVVLPETGGRELAEQLMIEHPEIRVLYMSGYTDHAIVSDGVLDPDVAFLQKPFTINDLWRKVRSVLDTGA